MPIQPTVSTAPGQAMRIYACLAGGLAAAVGLLDLLITLLYAGVSTPQPALDWIASSPLAALGTALAGSGLFLPALPLRHSLTLRRRISLICAALLFTGALFCLAVWASRPALSNLHFLTPLGQSNITAESALGFLLLATAQLINLRRGIRSAAILLSAGCSLLCLGISVAALLAALMPFLSELNWLGSNVTTLDMALLLITLSSGTFIESCRKQPTNWQLGRAATLGFAFGAVALFVIGSSALRSQDQSSRITANIMSSEIIFAHCAESAALISQQHALILSYLLTDNLRFLNDALVIADQTHLRIERLERETKTAHDDAWLFTPYIRLLRETLNWSQETTALHREGSPKTALWQTIRRGDELLTRTNINLAYLAREHEQRIAALRLRAERVDRGAMLVANLGMLFGLALFVFAILRTNRAISERDKVRRELMASEQNYRTLADSGQALIRSLDGEHRCTYVNKVWRYYTGHGESEDAGDAWLAAVHPDDRHLLLSTIEQATGVRHFTPIFAPFRKVPSALARV